MNVIKFGHSCFLIEDHNTRILIDPGSWSEGHIELENLDAIFITHEHQDHCDIVSIHTLLQKNPKVKIYTNDHVGKILQEQNISFEIFEEGTSKMIKGIKVEAFGKDHAVIYKNSPCHNTGYMFGDKLFHPGDSLTIPPKHVEILALPVCAPWLKMEECIDFAKAIKPKVAFPIHDGMLKHVGPFHRLPMNMLTLEGIEWVILEEKKIRSF